MGVYGMLCLYWHRPRVGAAVLCLAQSSYGTFSRHQGGAVLCSCPLTDQSYLKQGEEEEVDDFMPLYSAPR